MREIFVERQKQLLRIAIRENEKLKECFIEEETGEPYPGEIYKGVVKNIVPAIKSAFIDIGHKKNVYMYLDNKFKNTKVKKGEEILVQVIKEDLGSKGAKVTNVISIPGRYCVLTTIDKDINFSKKIEDKSVKEFISRGIRKPKDIGVMIRTNAANIPIDVMNDEIGELYNLYMQICNKASYSIKPVLLFDGGGILGRVLRDRVNEVNNKIYLDTEQDYEYVKKFSDELEGFKINIKLHQESRSLFSYYGIEKEILSLKNNKVMLSCGGYIVIDKTEAMYVIDVNSGKNVKSNSIEKTAYITNYQAAEEIVRQVRLRNLSGIILVDFIDMDNIENREKVMGKLTDGFKDDKNKTVIYPFTELNLVQIARRRSGKSISEYIEEDCGNCSGKGKRVKFSYISMLIRNEIVRMEEQRETRDIHIQIDESYRKDIENDILGFVSQLDSLGKRIYVTYGSNQYFKVEPLIFRNQVESLQDFIIYPISN